jgi:hypothetical protein
MAMPVCAGRNVWWPGSCPKALNAPSSAAGLASDNMRIQAARWALAASCPACE